MAVELQLLLGARADDLLPAPAPSAGGSEGPSTAPSAREAIQAFGRAARREPGDADYDFLLGCALLRAGEPARAAERCADAVRLDRANPDYPFALGCALWQLGRDEDAEAAFREAAELRPEDVEARNARGAALVRLGRAAEAAAVFEDILAARPLLLEARSNLGVALWELGHKEDAVRSLRRAALLLPERSEPHRNLGLVLLDSGRAAEAVDPLRRAAALSPGLAPPLLDLADAAFEAGRRTDAEEAFDAASRLDPRAIASRPRSMAARDALRRDRLLEEAAEPRWRPDPVGAALRALATAEESLRRLRRARGPLGATLVLGATLALATVAFRVLPRYVDHYLLRDDLAVVARAPVEDDGNVRDRLAHAIRERGLESVVDPDRCEIRTSTAWRRITCAYTVPLEILPGWSRRLSFRIDVEQPFVAPRRGE